MPTNLEDLQHLVIGLAGRGAIPDALIRWGIRRMCEMRLRADVPADAGAQHYEVPPAFFERVLGARLEYSCCFLPDGVSDLDRAEAAAAEARLWLGRWRIFFMACSPATGSFACCPCSSPTWP